MWRSLFFCLGLMCATTPQAECSGPSDFDALSPEIQTQLRAQSEQAPNASGLLWQVEKNGHRSYIIGTLHLPVPRLDAITARVATLMQDTDQLLLELTLADEAAFQTALTSDPSLFLITEGPSLIDRLGEEAWNDVATILKSRGIPSFTAARYQPWFLGLTLAIPPCVTQALQNGELGLDRQLEQIAMSEQLPTASLDTVDGLLALFSSDPLETQVTQMKDAISAGILGESSGPATIIDLYFKEETQLIWTYEEWKALQTAEENGGGAEVIASQLRDVEQGLVIDRNTAWMQTLVESLSNGPTTVAVGALHLPGKEGLLAQLKARGFSVMRVSLDP